MEPSEYHPETDNPEDWGGPLPARPTTKLDTMVSARFSSEEAIRVRRAASAEGLSLSEFVRRATLGAVDRTHRTTATVIGSLPIATAAFVGTVFGTSTGGSRSQANLTYSVKS